MYRYLTFLILLGFFSVSAIAPIQSHPLSEITPVDEDLNMSNFAVENVSSLQLNPGSEPAGLKIENLTISNPGEFNRFELDYLNDEWDIYNSDLDLNENNLTGVGNISGFFDSAECSDYVRKIYPNGSYVCGTDSSGAGDVENLSETLKDGNQADSLIDMTGNRIANVSAPQEGGDAVNKTYVDNNAGSGTDDQNLQYSLGNQPTDSVDNQEIGIEDGNNITFKDLYELDDQTLSNSGNRLVIDSGNSLYVSFANNSDTLDGNEGSFYRQNLAQTLSEANYAGGSAIFMNQSGIFEVGSGNTNISSTGRIEAGANLDLDSGGIENLNNLYSDSGSTGFFTGGASSSETVTGISSGGVLQTSSILVGNSNILVSSVNRSQIIDGEVTSSELNTGVSGTGLSGGGGSSLSVNFGSSAGTAAEGDVTLDVSAGTALTGGGSLTVGDDTSSVTLDVSQGGISNVLIAPDAVNQSQLAQGNCSNNELLKWDGSRWSCVSESSIGSDSQDLQYSLSSNPAGASNSQEIGITGGNNISFEDVYNPNQTLGTTDDTTGTNDTITITGGNSIEIDDDVNDADADPNNEIQSVEQDGDRITLSQDGQSIYVTFANDSDTLDSLDGSFYNQSISVDTSGTDDEIQLSTGSSAFISDEVDDADADPSNEYQSLEEVLSNGTSAGIYNISLNGNDIENLNRLFQDESGTNFFDGCSSGQYVESINSDGSVNCASDDTGSTAPENLSETLAAGNVMNRSIDLAAGQAVQIGTSTVTNDAEDVAIGREAYAQVPGNPGDFETAVGYQANASGSRASALGRSSTASGSAASAVGYASTASGADSSAFGRLSDASGDGSAAFGEFSTASATGASAYGRSSTASGTEASAFGRNSEASTSSSVAIGRYAGDSSTEGTAAVILGSDPDGAASPGSEATGDYSMALGPDASATANGAVGIGYRAEAPNQYEATFGNLGTERLDVNVTGNLTVHGSGGLDMKSNQISNVQDPTESQDAATKSYVDSNADGSPESLNQTLEAGNLANQSIDMNGNDVSSVKTVDFESAGSVSGSSGDICMGDRC